MFVLLKCSSQMPNMNSITVFQHSQPQICLQTFLLDRFDILRSASLMHCFPFSAQGMTLHKKAAEDRLASTGSGQSFLARQRQATSTRRSYPGHVQPATATRQREALLAFCQKAILGSRATPVASDASILSLSLVPCYYGQPLLILGRVFLVQEIRFSVFFISFTLSLGVSRLQVNVPNHENTSWSVIMGLFLFFLPPPPPTPLDPAPTSPLIYMSLSSLT